MAKKPAWRQGEFVPKNTEKYVGKYPIVFRSQWEATVMATFDNHPNVVNWSSESIAIPYLCPLTGKKRNYYPDFFVVYIDANGKQHAEIVEVKPASQSLVENAKSRYDKLHAIVNDSKWAYAREFCKRNGILFRVITEHDIFRCK